MKSRLCFILKPDSFVVNCSKGDRFTIRCGKTTIGTGVVTDIVNDVTEKQVEEWFTMKANLKEAI